MTFRRLLKSGTRKYIKRQNILQRQILCLTFRSKTAIDKIFKVKHSYQASFSIILHFIKIEKKVRRKAILQQFTSWKKVSKNYFFVLRSLSHNVASFYYQIGRTKLAIFKYFYMYIDQSNQHLEIKNVLGVLNSVMLNFL